jgi:ATP-dependent helicase/DNAse subunit B
MPYFTSLRRYKGDVLVSPTFFEEFGACAFAFWAKRIIGLVEPEAPSDEVHPLSRGAILHAILHRFLTQARDEGLLPLEPNERTIDLLNKISQEEMELAEKRLALGRKPLWEAKQKDIFRTLFRWLEFETNRTDGLIPQWFEWSFGPEDEGHKVAAFGFSNDRTGGRCIFRGGWTVLMFRKKRRGCWITRTARTIQRTKKC